MTLELFFVLLSILLIAICIFLFIRNKKIEKELTATKLENIDFRDKYSPIIDLDHLLNKRKNELSILKVKYDKLVPIFQEKHESLSNDYSQQMKIYQQLKSEIDNLYGNIDSASFGIYEPYFDYDTPEAFKDAIKDIRNKQKDMIKADKAAPCDKEWQVGGSSSEGKKMVKKQSKLMLRAFNGECDAIIAKVKWDNIKAMESRMKKSWEDINKSGQSMEIYIDKDYLELKINELHLNFELAEKRQQIKEEQQAIREQMREEEKVRKELERAKKLAEDEERLYTEALDKARKELETIHGEDTEAFMHQIAELEAKLAEAHEKSQRAISRAQETRSGHVYIISNVGSFGKDIYKIGMTRRLEPLDRVKELGDASVPFLFDVHGMIYTEDAPSLEKALHEQFNDRRLNLVNNRKEYFKVSLSTIQEAVKDRGLEVELTKVVEAQEYRETLAIRRELLSKQSLSDQEPSNTMNLPKGLPASI
ncbi:DUF4041 domain-containing protein [Nitrincola schmidtii]|uniref:DUF4041 domain-containing protein n=1 Tax=Nitrincola schmidtii TaxID=1730894 RepID=UPI00124E134C|nr:DUF4041 domain-containing protein [Nitrincola schmidtii]